jgi:hypothetical protein
MKKESRPARARGLKPGIVPHGLGDGLSRPARARGLKLAVEEKAMALASRAPRGRVD